MKRNNKAMLTFLIVIVSVAIVACFFYILLDNTGKINQGVFRTNDAIITSLVTVQEKQENKEQSMISDLLLDLSQQNTLSMLITKDSTIKEMYIDNIKYNLPSKIGTMYITQPNREEKYELNDDLKKVNIYSEDEGNQYLVEIQVNNVDFAKDVKVPEDTKLVKFDGTLIGLTGMDVKDLMFNISFNLNIIDQNDKLNVCKINMSLPGYELANSGIGITRENLSKYVFSVKNNFLNNLKFLKK